MRVPLRRVPCSRARERVRRASDGLAPAAPRQGRHRGSGLAAAPSVEQLIDDRNQAKINKDYQIADQIRKQIESYGVLLEDTPQGTVWRKK